MSQGEMASISKNDNEKIGAFGVRKSGKPKFADQNFGHMKKRIYLLHWEQKDCPGALLAGSFLDRRGMIVEPIRSRSI